MSYAVVPYDRQNAVAYARRWAFGRNPLFMNYAGIGGDCTNFASQCLLAGCCVMNYTPIYGWYYLSQSERTASWTGVKFFYDFILSNTGQGPFALEVSPGLLLEGDIIQLGRSEQDFYHTLVVTGFSDNDYLVSAHSDDSLDRPLSTYSYRTIRFLHIEGIRISVSERTECFDALISGTALPSAR